VLFLGFTITEITPTISTLSLIRQRLPEPCFSGFQYRFKRIEKSWFGKGKNIALDTFSNGANASLSHLQNRMTEDSYSEYISKLAEQSGVDPKDKEAVARFDRKRKDRKTSNDEWYNPHDPDAKIGRTKDGATDMIYKPENTVDLDTGAILDADILFGDRGDTDGLSERIINAQIRLNDISENPMKKNL